MNAIKLIAFDAEGTLVSGSNVSENIWARLNLLAGISAEEDAKWYEEYYSKKITHEQWCAQLAERYNGNCVSKQMLEQEMNAFVILPGAKEALSAVARVYPVCIISSAFDYYIKQIADHLGVGSLYANYSFEYNDSGFVSSIKFQGEDDKAKVEALKDICEKHKLAPGEIVFVGDSSNVIPAFKFTGKGILVGKGNAKTRDAAWKQVNEISEIAGLLL